MLPPLPRSAAPTPSATRASRPSRRDPPPGRASARAAIRERAAIPATPHRLPQCASARGPLRSTSQLHHSSRPSPRSAESWNTRSRGFTFRAYSKKRSRSNWRCGSKSSLFRTSTSQARNMWGYFSGLSSPSVTEAITTLGPSPRSKERGAHQVADVLDEEQRASRRIDGALQQRGLARAGRGHEVEGGDPPAREPGAVALRQAVVLRQDVLLEQDR